MLRFKSLHSPAAFASGEPPFLWLGRLSSFPVPAPLPPPAPRTLPSPTLPSAEDGCGRGGAGLWRSDSPRPPGGRRRRRGGGGAEEASPPSRKWLQDEGAGGKALRAGEPAS